MPLIVLSSRKETSVVFAAAVFAIVVGRQLAGQPRDPAFSRFPNIAGMPFKSKAQRRKFAELLVTGKISDQTYEEWNRSTGRKTLPERIHPKAGQRSKAKKRSTSKTKTKKAGPRSKARKR